MLTRQQVSNRFYEPEVTAYRFFKWFFAHLIKRGVTSVPAINMQFFYDLKQDPENHTLMNEITFSPYNGIFRYSADVHEGYNTIWHCGILSKRIPADGRFYIEVDNDYADGMLEDMPSEYEVQMLRNIDMFLIMEADQIHYR